MVSCGTTESENVVSDCCTSPRNARESIDDRLTTRASYDWGVGDTPWLGDTVSLVEAFRRGERSPVEELQATYDAIDASELNAFCFLDRERALDAARTADVSLPFGGVPKSKDTKRINIGALLAQDRGMARDYVRAAYEATWGQGGDPNSDELLTTLAAKLDWDAEEFLGYVGSPAAEVRYDTIFEEAVKRGVFGVPIMLVGDEMWWGNDRLDFLEQFLEAQG